MNLSWRMLGLAREYRLFNGKQIVGLLKNNVWNSRAYGEFKGHLMRFEKDSKRRYQASILDIEGEKVLGTIEFGYFPRTATIHYEGEIFTWKSLQKNGWGSWAVGNAEEESQYLSSNRIGTQGAITEGYLPPLVTMAGLYIHSYFFRRSLLSIVVGFALGVLMGYFVN
ncbi:hypothetical protein [Salmonirosea aquatica]|uniref:Uncharacterized protein n=1 Tax=Salmonirosea aquatica TaxID=2654236 RepID=A0A7C9F8M6_9BACT|nr:hypothetical protein [Cytophagaceae bacterium SJW1-29]